MLSPAQVMNTVYNRFHLVGTYGAFGSITRPRYEVIVEGTDEPVLTASTKWRAYEFKGKPGGLGRMPPQIAPYHLRLDWLMWFAALSSPDEQPWFAPFMQKLLTGDRAVLSLMGTNPFPDQPPRYVRAMMYEYHFTSPAERAATGNWWTRQLVSPYFLPISLRTRGGGLEPARGFIPAGGRSDRRLAFNRVPFDALCLDVRKEADEGVGRGPGGPPHN
jgi:hypothetical protein